MRMIRGHSFGHFVCAAIALALAGDCFASAFVRGAYYQLGDADPGATAGAVGNNPTLDSFSDNRHLNRFGSPHYSGDVPSLGPAGNKLSMAFANQGLGGPAFPGLYGGAPLPMVEQGLALEAWVKAGPTNLDSIRDEMVAFNGQSSLNGFGFFLFGENYVLRLGSPDVPVGGPGGTGRPFEVVLGPADVGAWHHLAYVRSLGTSSYYYDGRLVAESNTHPAPAVATEGFFLGGQPSEETPLNPFNGWVDEVRYQTFNPLAAGSFNPTAFLIVPEPAALAPLLCAAVAVLTRRRG